MRPYLSERTKSDLETFIRSETDEDPKDLDTEEQVKAVLKQYVSETGQHYDPKVRRRQQSGSSDLKGTL